MLAGAMLPALVPSEATATQPLLTGITNTSQDTALGFTRTRATGARYVRIPLHWAAAVPPTQPSAWEPTDPSDPNYRWRYSDAVVTNAVAAGLTPVLQVGGAPAWAQRCRAPDLPEWTTCDPDPVALSAFATAAARRYSGQVAGIPRVTHWQVLNEPNLSLFFFPQFGAGGELVSPALYRSLANGVYAAVKSVDRSNLVIAGGLGPIAVPPWTVGPMRFARELLCMRGHRNPHPAPGDCGGGVRFDIFAIQPYTTGAPTREGKANDVQLGDLGKLQALLRAAERAGRIKGRFKRTPLWITEFSWDSSPPDPGGLPMRIATRWTAEALYTAWRAGVSHFFWYSLRDSEPDPSRPYSETLESGLYFRGATLEEDQPKPVMFAFRFPFVAFPRASGLQLWGRTPSSGPGKVTIQVWERKRWQTIRVVQADRSGIFRGSIPTRYGSAGRGAVRALHGRQVSVPFAMRNVEDFRHPPFG